MRIEFEETIETKSYKSLPNRELKDAEYRKLRRDSKFDEVAPIAGYPSDNKITHLTISYNGIRRYVGWNPYEREWLEIAKIPNLDTNEDIEIDISVIFDEETKEPILNLDDYMQNKEFSIESLYDYIQDHIEERYSEEKTPIMFF